MPFVFTGSKTLYFAHVPKTGGTSVENYLLRRFGTASLLGSGYNQTDRRNVTLVPPQHFAVEDLVDFMPWQPDYSFAVVRDPVRRIVSEYTFQSGTSRLSMLSFSQWLRSVLAAARCEPRTYDNHIRPQSDLVPQGSEIFKLEEGFDRLITCLDEVVGSQALGLVVEHLLKSSNKRAVTIRREDIAQIREFYAVDYERFRYPDPDMSAYKPDGLAAWRSVLALPIAAGIVAKRRYRWATT